jgi:hypothetical protein
MPDTRYIREQEMEAVLAEQGKLVPVPDKITEYQLLREIIWMLR